MQVAHSAQVMAEFPTLAARGMNAIGRFGIGFFSVFMLGEEVRVTTRRYDRGEAESLTLEFRTGLGSRPILSPAAPGSAPLDGGTRIEIRLRADPRTEAGIVLRQKEERRHEDMFYITLESSEKLSKRSLTNIVAWWAPASEVSIDVVEFGQKTRVVNAGDWRTAPPAVITQRVVSGYSAKKIGPKQAELIRLIVGPNDTVYGRAALLPETYVLSATGVLTAGGLRVKAISYLLGIVTGGEVETVARDQGRFTAPPDAFAMWATEQGRLLEKAAVTDEQKAEGAEIIIGCGGTIGNLPIAYSGNKWLTVEELRPLIASKLEIVVHVGKITHESDDDVGQHYFDREFTLAPDIIIVAESSEDFMYRVRFGRDGPRPKFLLRVFEDLLQTIWGGFEESDDHYHMVGDAGAEIFRPVTIYSRADLKN